MSLGLINEGRPMKCLSQVLLLIFIMTSAAAHNNGRTDSNGGHKCSRRRGCARGIISTRAGSTGPS